MSDVDIDQGAMYFVNLAVGQNGIWTVVANLGHEPPSVVLF